MVRSAESVSNSTTERVITVLSVVGGAVRPIGVSEVGRQADLSKAVVHRILQVLVGVGWVAYDDSTRKYRLGAMAIQLGAHALSRNKLRQVGEPIIAQLAQHTGETTTICERVGHGRVYVAQVESAQLVRISITVGEHQTLTSGASGQSILAFMPDEDIDIVLRTPVPQYTERTLTDPGAIRDRLTKIKARGWAITESERVEHSSSIAAPVFGLTGLPVGSVSVAFIDSRFSHDDIVRVAERVMAAARDISQLLNAQ